MNKLKILYQDKIDEILELLLEANNCYIRARKDTEKLLYKDMIADLEEKLKFYNDKLKQLNE